MRNIKKHKKILNTLNFELLKPLVVIPARGGSKGLPGKNIKKLMGKPLIHYTIEAARTLFSDEQIIVSTDDLDIKSCAEETGLNVPFIRPAKLATDTASTIDVLLHALKVSEDNQYVPDTLILLQPTSPLRDSTHIRKALKLFNEEVDMIVSVKETKSNPYYILFEEDENGYLQKSKKGNFTRRQDCPKVWEYNGAIYIINVQSFKKQGNLSFDKVLKFEMDEKSSVDIDTETDFAIAEKFIKEKKGANYI
jgi:CMP-N,N'-diacetyllegionaminic acid synthase